MFIETNWMKKENWPGGIIGTTERQRGCSVWNMDATVIMTGDLKKMSRSEECKSSVIAQNTAVVH